MKTLVALHGLPRSGKSTLTKKRSIKTRTIVIADADDWQGIYIDGKLAREDHTLDLFVVLDLLGIEYARADVSPEWIEERGRLPVKESEVEWAD